MKDHSQYAETLALYALGALDNREDQIELEAHLESCTECRQELGALRGDAALLALSTTGPMPPQRARQRLLEAISADQRKSSVSRKLVIGVLHPRWLAIAPVAATLLLAIFSLMLWREDARLRHNLEQAQAEAAKQDQQLQQVQAIVDLLKAPNAMHMTLVAAKWPAQPQAKTVYVPRKGLLLMANNMEQLPQNKVYELWLLPADGSPPMPAGTFKPDRGGNALMHHPMHASIQAKAFAITIEPEGGSQTPTMPIVMGPAG
jgi:Anti-sigma-K factor rskA/Putative zinc-finger